MTEPRNTAAQDGSGDASAAAMSTGDGWDHDDGGGRRPGDDAGRGIVVAFGQTMKTLRLRAGLEREEFGRRLGYSASTIAAFEQGRRIPLSRTIDKADEVLGADGVLSVWKKEVERAQYPGFFQGMAVVEKEAIELLSYSTLVLNGLVQTEEYMRAVLGMRCPILDEETIEQRVAARLARQDIFDRWPAPLLSFVIGEAVLRHPYGGKRVLRGQLEHLHQVAQKRNVAMQVMPIDCEVNAGVDGPFTIVTRKDGKKFAYAEAQGSSALQSDPEHTALIAARYGIIRSQALTSRESLAFIEGLLGSL